MVSVASLLAVACKRRFSEYRTEAVLLVVERARPRETNHLERQQHDCRSVQLDLFPLQLGGQVQTSYFSIPSGLLGIVSLLISDMLLPAGGH